MNYTFTCMLIASLLLGSKAIAQQPDSLKKEQITHLRKDLSLSETLATQVVNVMNNYKESAKKVINDKKLPPEELKLKLNKLVDEKNRQLALLLNDEQFKKIVPTTERTTRQ